MTSVPSNLLAVRSLLLTYLNFDTDTVRAADLEPAEVGIVGDANHRGGYHCGSDRLDASRDYSVTESDRDRSGLTLDASALDVGMFSLVKDGQTHNLRTFSRWVVAQCVAGAPDTRDIREVIYSPDGEVVRRYDRLKRRATGDDSHLTHTHFSFFRDSTRARRPQTPLFLRYLTAIGLLTPQGGPIMFCRLKDQGEVVRALQVRLSNLAAVLKDAKLDPGPRDGEYGDATKAALRAACLKVNPSTGADGSAYNADTIFYVDALMARAFGGGGGSTLTVDQVADELARRMAD